MFHLPSLFRFPFEIALATSKFLFSARSAPHCVSSSNLYSAIVAFDGHDRDNDLSLIRCLLGGGV